MSTIDIYTIGFTQKTAEYFFEKLKQANVARIVDIRLNNASQLAGFTKRDDFPYLLKEICHIDYVHLPELAPTKQILDSYKKQNGDWNAYQEVFLKLLKERRIEDAISKDIIHQGCLLCSEDKPDHCHRRLVAEYLRDKWGDVTIRHLV